jgi:chemotaxis protein histidine kinase CheA
MNASEKNSFEEQWRDAFENAEVTPDPAIWATIETHLADAEANKYKRQLYVFKLRVAAAAALLILATGSWLVWQSTHSQQDVLAHTTAAQSATAGSAVTATQSSRHSSAETTTPKQANASYENQNSVSTPSSKQSDASFHNSKNATADNPTSIRPEAQTPVLAPQSDQTAVAQNHATPEKQPTIVGKHDGSTLNHSTHLLARTNPKKASRPHTDGSFDAPNSIVNKSKTPGIETPQSEANTIVENVVAVHTEQAQDSRVSVQTLTARSISAQKANMPLKDIRWQLNQAFWDQLAVADAQEQAQKAAKKSRWQIGAGVTPGSFNPNFSSTPSSLSYGPTSYGMDRTVNTNVAATAPPARTDLRNLTRPGVSYNTGIQAEFAISERFSVQGGVQYTYNQSQIEMTQYIKSNQQSLPAFYELFTSQSQTSKNASAAVNFLDATTGYATTLNTNSADPLDNTYQYMGFPMRFLYKVFNKKIKASVGAGVSADLFLRNRISSDASNIQAIEFTSSQNSIYKNMSMSGLLSFKLDYSVGNRYSIYLEPTYRRAITSFTTSSTLDSFPSWWGVGTGIQYRF